MATPADTSKYQASKRWTADLVADGFTPVSIFFLDNYAKLVPPITHAEAMLVIHLMRYKWTENAPYPGFKTIAAQMGISAQMARQHARSLDQKNYLNRVMQVGATNKFDLSPLFAALTKLRHRTVGKAPAAGASPPAPPPPPPSVRAKKPPLPPKPRVP